MYERREGDGGEVKVNLAGQERDLRRRKRVKGGEERIWKEGGGLRKDRTEGEEATEEKTGKERGKCEEGN